MTYLQECSYMHYCFQCKSQEVKIINHSMNFTIIFIDFFILQQFVLKLLTLKLVCKF